MGKWCLEASSFIFDEIFKLTGNQDSHMNLQNQLTFQMKIYWVPCGCNSSYSFPLIVLKLFRWFLQGMKMCMWFECNPLIISFHFFCFVNLVFFRYEILSKCIDSGGTTPLTGFLQLFWNFARLLNRMKMCMWFGYNTLIIFSHFFCFVNLVSCLTWNAIEVYRQWVPCGHNSAYSFFWLFWNFADVFSMEWRYACGLVMILYFFSLFLLCELGLFFCHEMVSKCIDKGTLWAQLLLQFSFNCFETLQMFSEWNENVRRVWYNPLMLLSHLL